MRKWLVFIFIFVGRKFDHFGYSCQWLTNWQTDSLLFSRLGWSDPGLWRCQFKTSWWVRSVYCLITHALPFVNFCLSKNSHTICQETLRIKCGRDFEAGVWSIFEAGGWPRFRNWILINLWYDLKGCKFGESTKPLDPMRPWQYLIYMKCIFELYIFKIRENIFKNRSTTFLRSGRRVV